MPGIRDPQGKDGGGLVLALIIAADREQAGAALHHCGSRARETGIGQNFGFDILGGVVRVGHVIAQVEYACGGADVADELGGLPAVGGIAVLHTESAVDCGLRHRLPDARKCFICAINLPVCDQIRAQRSHIDQKIMIKIVDLEHVLAAGPVVILRADGKELIKIGHAFNPCAGFGGKAVKERLVQKAKLGGFRDGQHQKLVAELTFGEKIRHEGGDLLFGKVLAPVQQAVGADLFHRPRIGREQIRQRDGAGFIVCRSDQRGVDIGGIGHGNNGNSNALFLARGTVEFINQRVQRRFRLAPVHMPHRQRDGILR